MGKLSDEIEHREKFGSKKNVVSNSLEVKDSNSEYLKKLVLAE